MKKIIPGFICLLLITTCGFEMPESITVKGAPKLYVPLGSPFARMDEKDRLENLISRDAIKEMMNQGGDAGGIEVYVVSPDMAQTNGLDKKVLTYLVDYQLADMPLDLQKYMDDAMEATQKKQEITIPDIPANYATLVSPAHPLFIREDGSLTDANEDEPFLRIPLNDMGKLVKVVRRDVGDRFGLKIPEIPEIPDLQTYLQLKIPALGIADYMSGIRDGNDLLFYDTVGASNGKPFYPRDDLDKNGSNYEIQIFAQITGAYTGTGKLDPDMVFEWKTADIDTNAAGSSYFSEEYPIGNNLGQFLGEGTSFKKVLGYVYMSGVGSNNNSPVEMKVTIGGDVQTRYLKDATPDFTVDKGGTASGGNFTTSSFTDDNSDPLELAAIFEDQDNKLKVDINLPSWTITNEDEESISPTIKSRLLVLIPMDLEVFGVTINPSVEEGNPGGKEYVKLNLKALNKIMGDDDKAGDLFGRKDGEDNALKDISYVNIGLRFSRSDITLINSDNLAVLVTKSREENSLQRLMEFKSGKPLKLTSEFFEEIPFNPDFSVLLEKDKDDNTGAYKNTGSFQLLYSPKPSFNFRLYVEAQAALEYTLDL